MSKIIVHFKGKNLLLEECWWVRENGHGVVEVVVYFLEGYRVVVQVIVPHVLGFLGSNVRGPGKQLFSLKEVIKEVVSLVGALVNLWKIELLSVTV
jgi:hypothetical protein